MEALDVVNLLPQIPSTNKVVTMITGNNMVINTEMRYTPEEYVNLSIAQKVALNVAKGMTRFALTLLDIQHCIL
jgi:hypothetical protein